MTDFMTYVRTWEELQAEIEKRKKELKPLTDRELEMRKALAASVAGALGDTLKEGMNDYVLPDGRTLKLDRGVKRVVVVESIQATREAYVLLNDRPVEFDDLLRVKYELEKKPFNKLEGEAAAVVSRMLTTKEEAPKLAIE